MLVCPPPGPHRCLSLSLSAFQSVDPSVPLACVQHHLLSPVMVSKVASTPPASPAPVSRPSSRASVSLRTQRSIIRLVERISEIKTYWRNKLIKFAEEDSIDEEEEAGSKPLPEWTATEKSSRQRADNKKTNSVYSNGTRSSSVLEPSNLSHTVAEQASNSSCSGEGSSSETLSDSKVSEPAASSLDAAEPPKANKRNRVSIHTAHNTTYHINPEFNAVKSPQDHEEMRKLKAKHRQSLSASIQPATIYPSSGPYLLSPMASSTPVLMYSPASPSPQEPPAMVAPLSVPGISVSAATGNPTAPADKKRRSRVVSTIAPVYSSPDVSPEPSPRPPSPGQADPRRASGMFVREAATPVHPIPPYAAAIFASGRDHSLAVNRSEDELRRIKQSRRVSSPVFPTGEALMYYYPAYPQPMPAKPKRRSSAVLPRGDSDPSLQGSGRLQAPVAAPSPRNHRFSNSHGDSQQLHPAYLSRPTPGQDRRLNREPTPTDDAEENIPLALSLEFKRLSFTPVTLTEPAITSDLSLRQPIRLGASRPPSGETTPADDGEEDVPLFLLKKSTAPTVSIPPLGSDLVIGTPIVA
ncbi:uncharacterized protein BJ171DRAFT_17467 [Polychytrium aggregatum]|uniref:uncharacterized protein n=1 Tax=Polychytrium aggregatum TaxID=110093 RepID=UPI0022FF24B9|nr:uncharacterized protein BJ171DRAFT_17467 [Polychytrium aggregatum]KAI9206686.1 hypothetical protein BJ171DRAFT_17467 [Polychytrium aggregatum]